MLRHPIITLTADNKQLSDAIMARIISMSITDNKNLDSDELSITLDDHDGALELPKRGVKLQCWWGFADSGTQDMGIYVVDSSEWAGSPDIINVKAKSADFKSSLKSGRDQSYHQTTLGDVAKQVADRHELTLAIKPELAKIEIGHIDQTDESDINLMTRLCHQYGAVVNIKHGKLLIFIANSNQSLSGQPLSLTTITRQTGDSFSFRIEDRQGDYDNVSANYQDKKTAQRETVGSQENGSSTGNSKTRKLKGTFKSKDAATAAVHSESKRIKEQQGKFSIKTAYAYPAVATESPIKLEGFKASIDVLDWTVDKAVHSYNKSSGATTQLDLMATLI